MGILALCSPKPVKTSHVLGEMVFGVQIGTCSRATSYGSCRCGCCYQDCAIIQLDGVVPRAMGDAEDVEDLSGKAAAP